MILQLRARLEKVKPENTKINKKLEENIKCIEQLNDQVTYFFVNNLSINRFRYICECF